MLFRSIIHPQPPSQPQSFFFLKRHATTRNSFGLYVYNLYHTLYRLSWSKLSSSYVTKKKISERYDDIKRSGDDGEYSNQQSHPSHLSAQLRAVYEDLVHLGAKIVATDEVIPVAQEDKPLLLPDLDVILDQIGRAHV